MFFRDYLNVLNFIILTILDDESEENVSYNTLETEKLIDNKTFSNDSVNENFNKNNDQSVSHETPALSLDTEPQHTADDSLVHQPEEIGILFFNIFSLELKV